ncbi:hypothetical protein OG394_23850 [Kribbella sp. NBC_01245]|uniref:hypothetical protein n=1 Tax=Kribbella sp. NBC_01245 TaxID=2903578 RepID=UPI002E29987F|nr:hypothetical protein [Kribbella sp. NBC_01245]
MSGSDASGENWLILGSAVITLAVIVLIVAPANPMVGGAFLGAGAGLLLFGVLRAWLGRERKPVDRRH